MIQFSEKYRIIHWHIYNRKVKKVYEMIKPLHLLVKLCRAIPYLVYTYGSFTFKEVNKKYGFVLLLRQSLRRFAGKNVAGTQ